MNKKWANVVMIIGFLVTLIAGILGIVYVLTGRQIGDIFIGHLLNDDGTLNKSEMPEKLAFIAMSISFISIIIFFIGLIGESKGMSRPESKEHSKKYTTLLVGVMLIMVSLLALAVLTPKQSNEGHGMLLYWIVVIVIVIGIITGLTGVGKVFSKMKNPIMGKPSMGKSSSKNEF